MRALLRANLDRQGTWLSATGVVDGRVPGSAEASMAEVSEPSLLLTLRWREADSNHRSREGGHRRLDFLDETRTGFARSGELPNATARRAARPSILRIWSAGMPRSSKEKTPVYEPIGCLAPPATICPRSRATAPTASLCFRPFSLIRSGSRSLCRQRIGSGATLSGRCCWPVRVQISISTGVLRRRSQNSAALERSYQWTKQ
jgi:hypothetical protein